MVLLAVMPHKENSISRWLVFEESEVAIQAFYIIDQPHWWKSHKFPTLQFSSKWYASTEP